MRDYDGAHYFDGSFYSQGTRERGGSSADNFIKAALLHKAGVRHAGARPIEPHDGELRDSGNEVGGHALTLRLLGTYLKLADQRDIRQLDTVRLHKKAAKDWA